MTWQMRLSDIFSGMNWFDFAAVLVVMVVAWLLCQLIEWFLRKVFS